MENGGAIYIPRGYFRHVAAASGYISSTPHEYTTISFGERYQNVRKELLRLRANGFSLKGFGDMTAAEISERTGLSQKEAELAKQREYDEPFVFGGDEKEFQSFVELVHQDGFFCLEGNIFHHLVGRNDKGKAVSLVIDLYRHEFGEITTAGLGDGPNDVPMLQAVDHPVVIQRADGSIAPKIKAFGFPKVGGPGPIGWNKAVLDLVANLGL